MAVNDAAKKFFGKTETCETSEAISIFTSRIMRQCCSCLVFGISVNIRLGILTGEHSGLGLYVKLSPGGRNLRISPLTCIVKLSLWG